MVVSLRPLWIPCLIFAVALLLPPAAIADPADYVWEYGDGRTSIEPDPNLCTFDDHLGRSPVNGSVGPVHEYVFTGILRDNQGSPVVNYPADLIELEILAPCANPAVLNPDAPTNALGELIFGALTLEQGGGSCAGAAVVEIRVNAVTFKTLECVASPDENGDGLVALGDLQIWQQAFVQQAPLCRGDLDFDDMIALSDLVVWQAHFTAP